MDMKYQILILAIVSSLSLASLASDTKKSTTKADFKEAYSQYQSALDTKDSEKAVTYAEQALVLGKKLYGAEHKTTAVLSFNYAQAFLLNERNIRRSERNSKKARILFNQVIKIYKKVYKKKALEFIDPWMSLGEIHLEYLGKPKRAVLFYKRAQTIAKANKKSFPLLYADLSLEIGKALLKRKNRIIWAETFLQSAYDNYHTALQANDVRLIDSKFWLAKYHYFTGDHRDAEDLFLQVVDAYKKVDRMDHPKALITSAFLVKTYEKMGKSEKATEYCLAIGKARPWDGDQQQIPIFLLEPEWPASSLRNSKGGVVKLSFIVNKQGFVKDPIITDSSGNKKLKDSVLEAVKKWRFAPKYVNGKVVEAKTSYTIKFALE